MIRTIENNLTEVKNRIAAAALKVGRNPETIELVAITKTVGIEEIKELYRLGVRSFGENRAQAFRDKLQVLSLPDARWHFVGNLQSNKIKYVYSKASLVHSIDRIELLEEFAVWKRKTGILCPCLLEVHISHEESKHGFDPNEVLDVVEKYRNRDDLKICGFMGMAPFVSDQNVIRTAFRNLAEIFQQSQKLRGKGFNPEILSMGMSGDFEIAIEEGATMVRIGTALFEGIK